MSTMRRIRVMKTPQNPDQDDLIRYIVALQEEERFVYDEMNTVMKTPQSPRDLIRMTWIRGILKNSRRRRVIRIARARIEKPRVAKEEVGRAQFVNCYEE